MIRSFFSGFGKATGWGLGLILVWVVADWVGIVDRIAPVGMAAWEQFQGGEVK